MADTQNEVRGYSRFSEAKPRAVGVAGGSEEAAGWKQFSEDAVAGADAGGALSVGSSDEVASQPWATGGKGGRHGNGGAGHVKVKVHQPWHRLVIGTMPKALDWVEQQHPAVQFGDACLRGVGQVFLMNNPLSGLIILVGIAVASWYMLLMGLVGLVASTGTAKLLGFDAGSIAAGLYGYNGILTGMALALFHYGDRDHPGLQPQIVFPCALMGAASALLTAALGKVTVSLLGMPPLTFPFQLTTWVWLLGAQSSYAYFPLEFPSPALNALAPIVTGPAGANATAAAAAVAGGKTLSDATALLKTYDGGLVVGAVFRGISEVFLVSDAAAGVLMLVGIAVCSRIAAAFALLGSVAAVLTCLALGVDPGPLEGAGPASSPLYMGLWGFNPCLTALCVGGLFFVLSRHSAALALLAAALTTVFHAAVSSFLGPVGLPALTFPFTLVTWLFILAGDAIAVLTPIPLAALTTPEDHSRRFRLTRAVTKEFAALVGAGAVDSLQIKSEADVARVERELVPALACALAAKGDARGLRRLAGPRGKDDAERLSRGDYDGRTPLMLAAAHDHLHVARFLVVEVGVDCAARDRFGGCALEDAVRARSRRIIELLMGQNQNQNNKGIALSPASTTFVLYEEMCAAGQRGDALLVALLLDAGVEPDVADYDGRTCLHLAASEGHLELIHLLVARGATVNAKDRFGGTPAEDAARHGHSQVQALLETPRYDTMTGKPLPLPAVMQVSGGSGGGGKLKLPPVQAQAQQQGEGLRKRPVGDGGSGDGSDASGASDSAGDGGGGGGGGGGADKKKNGAAASAVPVPETLAVVVVPDSDVGAYDGGGDPTDGGGMGTGGAARELLPSLMCSAVACADPAQQEQSVRDARELLAGVQSGGAEGMGAGWSAERIVSAADYDRRTPLMVAAAAGNAPAMEMLLAHGAKVDAVDRWGCTALWEALTNVKESAAQLLLTYGASLAPGIDQRGRFDAATAGGVSSRQRITRFVNQLVTENKIADLERLFRISGIDPNELVDYDGRSPLHLAAAEKKPEAVRLLISRGADANAKDRWGGCAADEAIVREVVEASARQ